MKVVLIYREIVGGYVVSGMQGLWDVFARPIVFRRRHIDGENTIWYGSGNPGGYHLSQESKDALEPVLLDGLVSQEGLVWDRNLLRVVALLRLHGIDVEVEE